MNENSRTCVSVWSPGQGGVGLGEWGMDAQTGAAGYNFTIKIEVHCWGQGWVTELFLRQSRFARKGQFFYIQIHQGIFGPNCQFGSNFLFLLLVAGCLCRWGLFTDFFALIKYVVNGLMSVG